MLSNMTGPIAAFSGAMGATCSRPATCIEVVENAVFGVLTLEFPTVQAGQAAMTAPTYPALFKILNVKSFKLNSGSILVSFRT